MSKRRYNEKVSNTLNDQIKTNKQTTNQHHQMKTEQNTRFTAAMLFNSDKALVQDLRNTHDLGEKEMLRVILNVVTQNDQLLTAEVAAFKQAIAAEREAAKAVRNADKQAAKAAKAAERASAKAAKQAEREAKKAEREAAKAAKQAEREAAKAAKQAAKAEAEAVAA